MYDCIIRYKYASIKYEKQLRQRSPPGRSGNYYRQLTHRDQQLQSADPPPGSADLPSPHFRPGMTGLQGEMLCNEGTGNSEDIIILPSIHLVTRENLR